MNLMLTTSSKHEDLVKELCIDMDKNLEPKLYPNDCCIYRVHKKLRSVNKEAYTPQMVSIGPLHHENRELANMEKIKRRYVKIFLKRREMIEKQDDIVSFVEENENKIRNCYSEISMLKSHEYIMMILYDAIFIIELFMRNYTEENDSFLSTIAIRDILTLDLALLENQLPYFVLEEICKLAFPFDIALFMKISRSFFSFFPDLELIELTSQKHFTDWRRSTLLRKYVGGSNELTSQFSRKHFTDWRGILPENYLRYYSEKGFKYLPCAMKLRESGVKFKKISEQGKLSFEKHKHELQLPQLVITDGSECLLRNVMALEQCLYPFETHICNYVYLMDCLIDTEKDVDLLVGSGIISNIIGDKSSTANMFNKLCRNISVSSSYYHETGEELRKHCDNPWKKKMATLKRVYFSNLWRGTATVAAVILVLLTVIQTICSIFQVV